MPAKPAIPRLHPVLPFVFHGAVLLVLCGWHVVQPDALRGAFLAWFAWTTALTLHFGRRPGTASTPAGAKSRGKLARSVAWLRRFTGRVFEFAWQSCLLSGALVALYFGQAALRSLLATPSAPSLPDNALAALLVLVAFGGYFLQTFAALQARQTATAWPVRLGAALLRATTVLCALGATLLLVEPRLGRHAHLGAAAIIVALLLVWIIEVGLRAAARLYEPPRLTRLRPPLGCGWPLFPFLTPADRKAWRAGPDNADGPTLALADMWFLPTLRRMLLPLAGVVALLSWLGTAFNEVPHGQVGLWTRLGRVQGEPLEPGLHLRLPYPWDRVTLVPTEKLQLVVLGLDADTGKPLLWEREHYRGEQNQLVGRGEEFLTISVPVYFKIKDAVALFRQTRDPEIVVRDLAYQILLDETLHQAAFTIMTTARDALAANIHRRLQTELDRRGTGIEIAMVCLRDIHPPVEVGLAYQDVVSALEEMEAFVHHAEGYHAEEIPRAEAQAFRTRAGAETVLYNRVAEVTGAAFRFDALLDSYRQNPELFRLRESYAVFDANLRGVKKLVVDDSFRGRLPTYVDVRRTLNPDFAPEPVPIDATLIPTLRDKPGDFDRAIDGYLQMGRGAIPAVDLRPQNRDNLLNSQP